MPIYLAVTNPRICKSECTNLEAGRTRQEGDCRGSYFGSVALVARDSSQTSAPGRQPNPWKPFPATPLPTTHFPFLYRSPTNDWISVRSTPKSMSSTFKRKERAITYWLKVS